MKTTVTIVCESEFYYNYIKNPFDEEAFKDKVPYPLWKNPGPYIKGKTTKSLPEGMKLSDVPSSGCAQKYVNFIGCPSTRNFLNKTIVIPLPSDVEVRYDPEQNISAIEASGSGMEMSGHADYQLVGMFPNQRNAKFIMPYGIRAKKQPAYFSPPHLHPEYLTISFLAMHGLTNIEKEQPCIINTMMQKEPFTDWIPAGTVLAYVTFPAVKGKVDLKFMEREEHNRWEHRFFSAWNKSFKY